MTRGPNRFPFVTAMLAWEGSPELPFRMRPNLDTLRHEIEQHLESRGLAVFRSYPRTDSEGTLTGAVYWDSENHPDYREFVEAAFAAGVRLVTLSAREFTADIVETALAHLADTDLERDESAGS